MWGWQCAFTCHVDITHASERLEKDWTRYLVFFTLWPTVDWSNAWFLLHWVTLILYPDPDWCQSQQVKDCRLPSGAMDNRKMSVEMRLPLLLLARCWTAAQQKSLLCRLAPRITAVAIKSATQKVATGCARAAQGRPRVPNNSLICQFFTHVDCNDSMLLTFDKTGGIMGSSRQPWFDFWIPCFTPLLPHQPPLPPFWPRSWLPGLFHFLPPPPHCPPSYKARGSSAFFALISTTT